MTMQMQDGMTAVRTGDVDRANVSAWLESDQNQIVQAEVVHVSVADLSVAGSPRVSGESREHVQLLAETDAELPPIIVHHATMQVIDGVHRLRAAQLRGEERIPVRFFFGDERDAFILAVKSNVAHGLPLSLADRKAAALRIITFYPQWSDRMIASISGIASRTVSDIRKQQRDEQARDDVRVGRDGRVRPINGSDRRVQASELMIENPHLSLRQVARAVGISPETARDVRHRLHRGLDPVPTRQNKPRLDERVQVGHRRTSPLPRAGRSRAAQVDTAAVIERLRADPALRFTETGRILLRLLHIHFIEVGDWERVSANLPLHCSAIVAHLARECAEMWQELADQVEQKAAGVT
jgi:ParB-like nuclease domain